MSPDRATPDSDDSRREHREYPHGSGDRNTWSPTGDDRMPVHGGGEQRTPDPDPTGPGRSTEASDNPSGATTSARDQPPGGG